MWKSGSPETGERTRRAKDGETQARKEMMGEQRAEQGGKGGHREGETRESRGGRPKEGHTCKQVKGSVCGGRRRQLGMLSAESRT